MTLPRRVTVVEVGPRDGLQNESAALSVEDRVAFCERLLAAGLSVVEVGAFVSPKWVPQMAGSDEVLRRVSKAAGARLPVLVPKRTGFELARAAGARDIAVFTAASETFSRRNTNASIDALEFARKSEEWVKSRFTKPICETWQELRGVFVFPLDTIGRTTYTSVQKVKTFTPPSGDRDFVFSQLSKNVENACIKLRRYNLAAGRGVFFLKLQTFRYAGLELQFSRPTSIPSEIIKVIETCFNTVYDRQCLYRATGIALFKLEEDSVRQLDLFNHALRALEMKKLYQSVDVRSSSQCTLHRSGWDPSTS